IQMSRIEAGSQNTSQSPSRSLDHDLRSFYGEALLLARSGRDVPLYARHLRPVNGYSAGGPREGRTPPYPLERNRPGRLPAAGGSARRNGWPFQALRGSPSHSDHSMKISIEGVFITPGGLQEPLSGCPEG